MGGILKGVQSVLIAMIILALLGTGTILWYNNRTPEETVNTAETAASDSTEATTETGASGWLDTSLPDGSNAGQTNVGAQHVHSYVSSAVTRPDCTKTGQMRYTCSCGDFYTDTIAALGHKEGEWRVVREATKTQDGLKQLHCSRCDAVMKEEVIDKSTVSGNSTSGNSTSGNSVSGNDGHVHSYKGEVTREATCTENGEKTYTCSCGSSYTAAVPALNHPSRQTVVTDAGCTTPGSVESTCALCKAVLSHDSIPELGHNWGSFKTVTPATLTAAGSEERTCSRCEEKETRAIPQLIEGVTHTHSYAANITTPATCTAAGTSTYTCSCGDTYTAAVAALGHNPGNWVTVTEPSKDAPGLQERYCRRCGELLESRDVPYVEACSHNYTSVVTREPTCQRSGTRTYTCSKCGDSYQSTIDPIAHKYVVVEEGGVVTDRVCNMCGQSDPTFVKPTTPSTP